MNRRKSCNLTGCPGDDVHQELPITAFSNTLGQLKMQCIIGSDGSLALQFLLPPAKASTLSPFRPF